MYDDFNPNIPPPKFSFLEEYIINKLKGYTLVMLIQGYPQTGKSTLTHFLLNNLSLKVFGIEWDYKKYCAKTIKEFSYMIKNYDHKFLVYEEASKDITIDKWYNDVNHAFNMIMQTQQYKKNLICLVFPFSQSISNRQKYFIKLGIETMEKIQEETYKAIRFRPTIYTRSFWRLDENDLKYKFPPSNFIKMNNNDGTYEKTQEYIDWLIEKKEEFMNEIDNDIRISERREKMKCAVCSRRIGLKKFAQDLYLCNMHYDYFEGIKI